MEFCGQCGYQLPPGSVACPRCGMLTQPVPSVDNQDASNTDGPTVAVPRSPTGYPWQAYPPTPAPAHSSTPPQPQQPISLRPYGNTPVPGGSPYPGPNSSLPGFPAQPPASSYPGFDPHSSPGAYDAAPAPHPRQRGHTGIIIALVVVLILLIINGALLWFLLNGRSSTTPTSTPTAMPTLTPALTPSQQAQALVQRYYDDINNRDYRAAYSLLGSAFQSSQPYNTFASGYAHTRHDTITFDSITPQSDGTVTVAITIQATEDAASGTGSQTSIYRGSDIAGQENGAWKILSGNLHKVSTVPG